MRQLAAVLSMLIALPAVATEMWRWKDADGVTHYSDRPVDGAERVSVLSRQKSGDATPTVRTPPPPPPPPEVRYTRCEITAPTNDQVFFGASAVDVSIVLDLQLQPDHQMQVLVNGLVDPTWQNGLLSRTLVNLYRGSYTLSVRVLDANGRPQCTGPTVNFHIRQPSLLAPGRKPPAKKP